MELKNNEIFLRSYLHSSEAFPKNIINNLVKFAINNITPENNNGIDYEKHPNPPPITKYERQLWNIPVDNPQLKSFYNLLRDNVGDANNYFKFDLTGLHSLHYCEYSPKDETPLNWHMDIENFSPYNRRKLSFSILVNDPKEYKGGDLEFLINHDKIEASPRIQGNFIIFPSYLMHRVTPITEGIRKVIVGFIEGNPFK